MPQNYLNTGVLGQVVGGTLSTSSLGATFRDYRDQVSMNRRSVSGVSANERQSVAKRNAARVQDALATTGVAVNTSDVKVPTDGTPNTAPDKGITKAPGVKSPQSTSAQNIAPEKQYTEADRAFAQALGEWDTRIRSKLGSGRVKGASSSITNQFLALEDLAKATGNQDWIRAVGAIEGVRNYQNSISGGNIGKAVAGTTRALTSIRNTLDIDSILSQAKKNGTTTPVSTYSKPKPVGFNVRGQARY